MAILTMEVGGLHSKPPSCTASRLAGRMAILTMEVGDFHSKPLSCTASRLAGRMAILTMEVGGLHGKILKHEEKESTHKGMAKRVPAGEKEYRRVCGRWLWSGIAEL